MSNPNKKYCTKFFSKDLQQNAGTVMLASSIKPKREHKDQNTQKKMKRRKEKMKPKQEKKKINSQNFGIIMWALKDALIMIKKLLKSSL